MFTQDDVQKLYMQPDMFAEGFTPAELAQKWHKLTAKGSDDQMLLENASSDPQENFDLMDQELNPGEIDEEAGSPDDDALEAGKFTGMSQQAIMEAVTIKQYSRTRKTMMALIRVLNTAMKQHNITVGDPIIGKPKKSGLFASVMVQLPLSDGQIITIIFHSPDNNKRIITQADEIIAFRWLLNKRDITIAVSPENQKDISLVTVAKRIAQLVNRNSQRFQLQTKAIMEQRAELQKTTQEAIAKQEYVAAKTEEITNFDTQLDTTAKSQSELAGELARIEAETTKLEAKLTELETIKATKEAETKGKVATVETTKTDDIDVSKIKPFKAPLGKRVDDTPKPTETQVAAAKEFDIDKKAIIDLLRSDTVVQLSENSVLLDADKYDINPLDVNPKFTSNRDMLYKFAIHYLLRDRGIQSPKELMNRYLVLQEKSISEALKPLRTGLSFAMLDLPDYEKSEVLHQINDDLIGSYSNLTEERIRSIAMHGLEVKTPDAAVNNLIPAPDVEEKMIDDAIARLDSGAYDSDVAKFQETIDNIVESVARIGKSDKYREAMGRLQSKLLELKGGNPTAGKMTPEEADFVLLMNELVNGEYDGDIAAYNTKLDELIAGFERLGVMEKYDIGLNTAVDHLTELLAAA